MRFALAMAAAMAIGGVARAAPLEAYGRLPSMDQVSISPDGAKVAFVQQVDGKYTVVVDQLNPAAVVGEIPPTDQKIRALVWADANHLLVVRSQTSDAHNGAAVFRGEWSVVQSLDLAAHKAKALFTRPQHGNVLNAVTEVPQVRTVNHHAVVFAPGVREGRIGIGGDALMSSDLTDGNEDVIDTNGAVQGSRSWMVDDQGRPVARMTYDQFQHLWTLQLHRGAEWADAYSVHTLIDMPTALGFTADGQSLILETIGADGRAERRLVSLSDGKVGEPESQYEGYSGWLYAPHSQRIVGGLKRGLEATYVFFEPKMQAAWDAVLKTFPDGQVDPLSWSDDLTKLVVKVTSAQQGIAYELVDLAARKVTPIGQVYAGIKPEDIADVQIIKYHAKDGMEIQAFLTLPTGRQPKNLPLIVLPHGGPADHDPGGFDWFAQALASRGYAVLQPEFRGSAGLGLQLEKAGYGEFGRKMQTDLSDGVRALAAAGYVDPKRVCIVGASYGGYAALAGVTLEHGVYRCAVSIAGLSDLTKFVGKGGSFSTSRSAAIRYWDRYVGATQAGDKVLADVSPAEHAAQASAPILLIHGKDDLVVPLDQSQTMVSALKRANKPFEFLPLDRGDHWLLVESVRLQTLQATAAFLEKNNPPN